MVDIPGANAGSSMQGLLSLEDGRLVLAYDHTATLPCSCTTTTCGQVCVSILGCGGVNLDGTSITVADGTGTVVGTCTVTGRVTSTSISRGGSFATPPTVTAPGGSPNATLTAVMSGFIESTAVTNGGTGFTSPPTGVTFSAPGGGGVTAAGSARLTPTSIGSLTLAAGGGGYTNGVGYALGFSGGGGGAGATGTFDVVGGHVTNVVLTNGGAGYVTLPTFNFAAAGGGVGASVTALLTPTSVASVTMTNVGSLYLAVPTAAVVGGGGAGVVLAPVLRFSVASVAIVDGGGGYTAASVALVFAGGSPTGLSALGTATITHNCCVPIRAAGTHTITAGTPGGYTEVHTQSLSCTTTNTFQFLVLEKLTVGATVCGGDGTDVTVVVSDSSGTLGTGTIPAGTDSLLHTITVNMARLIVGGTVTAAYTFKGRTVSQTGTPTRASCVLPTQTFLNKVCVIATGCNNIPPIPVVAASVSVTVPLGAVGSGTTDGTGTVCFFSAVGLAPGDVMTVTVIKDPRWADSVTSSTVAPPGGPGDCFQAIAVTMVAGTGYVCLDCFPCEPIKTVLNWTDPGGSTTITYSPTNLCWYGCLTHLASNVRTKNGINPCVNDPHDLVIACRPFFKNCGLGLGFDTCFISHSPDILAPSTDWITCADIDSAGFFCSTGNTVTVDLCDPFAAHVTITVPITNPLFNLFGGGPWSFSVSE